MRLPGAPIGNGRGGPRERLQDRNQHRTAPAGHVPTGAASELKTDGLATMAKQQAISEVAQNMYVQLSGM